jgi:photosystem II stability/assembly factor-like uncharacterized protein
MLGAVVLSGCAAADEPVAEASAHPDLSALDHVHGVAVDPADDAVLLATHEGLLRLSAEGDTRVGPVIDLMGFAVVGPGHFIASGHPGPGVDLPQPVGLIESTDGGESWQTLSRAGESDFHALTASGGGILGYDGSLLRSADGTDWEQLELPAPPAGLAATADGQQVLATTGQGVLLSVDAGSSWSPVPDAPVLQLVDWAADGRTAVGVDPAGAVWTGSDGAASWQPATRLDDAPQALDVSTAADGGVRVLVVTSSGIHESLDGGQTFSVVRRD